MDPAEIRERRLWRFAQPNQNDQHGTTTKQEQEFHAAPGPVKQEALQVHDRDAESEEKGWQCDICTMLNTPLALMCSCGTTRSVSPRFLENQIANKNTEQERTFGQSYEYPPSSIGTSLPPGMSGTMRNKRAYLHTAIGNGPSRSGEGRCYLQGNHLVDTNPISYESGGWIWVNDPTYQHRRKSCARVDCDEDVETFTNEYNSLLAKPKTRPAHKKLIVDLAKKHNVLHGKWLLDIHVESVTKVSLVQYCIFGN